MCGRTANGVRPECIIYGCQYQYQKNLNEVPEWVDPNQNYKASYNLSPTNYLPVLISKKHLNPCYNVNQRILMAMRWGLVPSYFKNLPETFKLHTFNCRSDRIIKSKIFKSCFNKGRRCVIIVEGYFEWKQISATKQKIPFFFFFPQKNVSFNNRDWMLDEINLVSNNIWKGPNFLTLAGLFDVCSQEGYEPLYSCSIITVDAHSKLRWCHSRMPAILKNEEEVKKWLDYENCQSQNALQLLKPFGQLEYHQVDNFVNTWKNQGVKCVLPFKETLESKNQSKIDSFFKKLIKKSEIDEVKKNLDEIDQVSSSLESSSSDSKSSEIFNFIFFPKNRIKRRSKAKRHQK